MNDEILAIISLLSLGLLFIYIFWLFRDYYVDEFRQNMFELRDAFFDEAANGRLDFSSPAYGMLRSTMNGLIRFGHRISVAQMVAIHLNMRRHESEGVHNPFSKRLNQHLKHLPQEKQIIIKDYWQKMNILLLRHLVKSSPLVMITLIVPLITTLAANQALRKLASALRRPIDEIDALAFTEGESRLQPVKRC